MQSDTSDTSDATQQFDNTKDKTPIASPETQKVQ